MKNLFLFIALICFVIGSSNSQTINMKNQSYGYYVGTAADTAKGLAGASFNIRILNDVPYFYDIWVHIDTVKAVGNDFYIKLEGSHNNTDMAYTLIGDSLEWLAGRGGSGDTTIRFTNLSTAKKITSTVGAHTITTAAYDIWVMDSIHSDDTLHVKPQTATVASHTITNIEADGRVPWQWLRVKVAATAATGKALFKRMDCVILKDD